MAMVEDPSKARPVRRDPGMVIEEIRGKFSIGKTARCLAFSAGNRGNTLRLASGYGKMAASNIVLARPLSIPDFQIGRRNRPRPSPKI
jgi:hypothetical protein